MNLRFTNLSKGYGGRAIFENVSGQIDNEDKVGLIGVNGVGKTTLANIIAGQESSDGGEINYWPSYAEILYIEQYPKFEKGASAYEYIVKSPYHGGRKRDIGVVEARAKKALNRIGLDEGKWSQEAASLSGGEKTKLTLARMFLCEYDFLILDEPTNHLDMESYQWLEDFLKGLEKPILIISHDRFFLDNTVNRIWEMESRKLISYDGNYSDYRLQKEIKTKNLIKEYDKQEAKIQQLNEVINDRENWYHRAHKAAGQNDYLRARAKKNAGTLKAKKTQLERLERDRVDRPRKEPSPAFDVINKNVIGRKFPRFLVQGKGISKGFDQKEILKDISFNIERGDKIAVIGPNGSGKTTFLKTLCGYYDDYEGELRIGPSINLAYFSQELGNLDHKGTILENVLMEGSTAQEARLLLACLLFRGDDVYKKIQTLSMGEKGRVAFAKLILSGANFLVLDEPTNYMDIESKEKIEEALEEFQGSIIFVSHDRYFIKRLANKVFVIKDENLYSYHGDYEYYLAKKDKEQRKNREKDSGNELGDQMNLEASIMKLEIELAFLAGRLDEDLNEEEKEELNKKYLAVARELNEKKSLKK